MYGWDVVYARTMDSTNRQLKIFMTENEITFTYVDENTSVTLTFDSWEIVSGGASKLLRMKTLVKAGEVTIMGKRTLLDGICPLLEIQLGFLQDKKRSDVQKLTFNFLIEGEGEGDEREGAVTVIDADLNNVISKGSTFYNILKLALAEIFIQNKEKMSYAFAELNVTPDNPWMKPKKYKYSYYSPTSGSKGLLTIFSVVTNRDITRLDTLIDGKAIDDNNDSFLILSEDLFLEHIIMPELPNAFGHGANKNDFRFENTSLTSGIIKNNKNLYAGSNIGYPVWIEELTIKIESNKLYMKSSGKCSIDPNFLYIKFETEAKYIFDYDSNKKIFTFKEDPNNPPKIKTEKRKAFHICFNNQVLCFQLDLMEAAFRIDEFKLNPNIIMSNLKNDVVRWSGMEQEEITDCILDVAFNIKGKTHSIISGNFQMVTALNNASVVDITSEKHGDVQLWANNGGNNQKWKFEYDNQKKAYQIKSVRDTNIVLAWIDVLGSRKVMVHRNEHKEEHYWVLQELKDDYYIIRNKKNRNLVLDVDGAKMDNGTNIKVNEIHSSSAHDWHKNAQKWKLQIVEFS